MKKRENWKLDWRNPEEKKKYYADYNKAWYQRNKEARSKQIKEYSKNHPKENVIRVQRYVKRHPARVKDYNKRFNQTIEGKYRLLLHRAKKWGAPYLTLEEFQNLLPLPCVYCGEDSKSRGIDRVDNKLGYSKENSAPACILCNFMKKALSKEEFLNHAKRIAKHNS